MTAADGGRPLSIWEVCSGPQLNGAVVHFKLVAEGLAARGHRVTAVVRPGSWAAAQAWDARVRVHECRMDRWPPAALLAEARRARAEEVDIVHSHMTRADNHGLALRLLAGVPSVATAHAHTVHPHWRLHDHVIAVSETTRSFHLARNRVRPGRISTVFGMIPIERYAPISEDERRGVRAEFGAADDDLVIGMLAHIHPRKGPDLLVEALPSLRARLGSKVRVVMAGEGSPEMLQSLAARAEALGVREQLAFVGIRTDVARTVAAYDILCLPSRQEAFSVAILESMAMRRPFVATLVGGSGEFVPADGPAGVLIPPENVARLADALVELASLPAAERAAMGARGRRFVEANFTVASQVPRIEAVLRQVASRRGRPRSSDQA
ncbi:MAG: glycosyltransferase family 4 protein [Armatimonadota bacterium]